MKSLLFVALGGAAAATHIATHWVPKYVEAVVAKLTPFYAKSI